MKMTDLNWPYLPNTVQHRKSCATAWKWVLLLSTMLFIQIAQAAIQFGQNEGLDNLSVQSAVQDEQGYIWAGTDDGVQRFDGHRFLRIELQLPDAEIANPELALRDNRVNKMLSVPGAVYLASATRVWRYDLKTHTLSLIRNQTGDTFRASALARTADGTILATGSTELWRWRDAPEARAVPIVLTFDDPITNINALHVGQSGVWLFTETGSYALKVDAPTLLTHAKNAHAVKLHVDEQALKFGAVNANAGYEYPRGVLWIGFWNDGLLRLDLATGKHRWLHPKRAGAGALRSTSIYSFAARDDRLYVGTNRGLVVYHPSCECMRGLNHPSWDQLGGAGTLVTTLVLENEADIAGNGGGVWAGLWGGGLVRFSPHDEAIERQVKRDSDSESIDSGTQSEGLAHPMVSALHVADKRLWIGTYGGGVQYVDSDARRIGELWPLKRLPLQTAAAARKSPLPIESKFVWHLSSDSNQLTIGTGFGLFRWQQENIQELQIADPVSDSPAFSLPLQSIRSTWRASDNTRYIGTTRGFYVETNVLGKTAITPITLKALNAGKPLPSGIWSIIEHNQQLWLGTGNGLIRAVRGLTGTDWQVLASHQKGAALDQLPGAAVWVQKHDASGTLWIGTSGGLLSVTGTPKMPVFERHPALSHIGVNSVTSIEFDRAGQLWLGSPSGLARYQPNLQKAELFDRFDGLISNQLNFNASARSGSDEPDEQLYFGGIGGIIAFNPASIPEAKENLQPRVAKLRLGQSAWQMDVRELALPHAHEALQVELTSLNFARPSQVRYAYRWANLDDEFTELGDAKSIVLARLPSGMNVLEVRSRLGKTEAVAEVLKIDIAYIWHETRWGRLLAALATGFLFYIGVRWRVRQTQQFTRVLQAEVAERTSLLRETTKALSQANAQLKIQATLDPLTGLANRRHLFEVAHHHAVKGDIVSVLVADLDHFKRINDAHGHHVGDAVLIDFAELLRDEIGQAEFGFSPNSGLAARYGGEEFVVLLFNVSLPQLEAFGERIVTLARARSVAQTKHLPASALAEDHDVIRYTASVGLVLGDAERSIETLIRTADLALYKAKNQGRDRWVLGN